MTVTADADQDQAEAPEPTPREKHLGEWLEAMAAADKLLRQVIADELAEDIPALERDQAKAASALEAAYAALVSPEQDLAELDAEIAGVEADRARWQAKTADETPREERAVARFQLAECEADIARLQQQREFAEAQLLPLRDEWKKARANLDQANAKLEGRKLNATPALAYYAAGQKADSYSLRFGLALQTALSDRSHYEHDAALEHMLFICAASGFRTEDHKDRLPDNALQAKKFWDSVFDNAQHPEPAPSGRQWIESVHADMTVSAVNKQLENSPVRIDDRRTAQPVRNPVPQRSWMDPGPSVRDLLGG